MKSKAAIHLEHGQPLVVDEIELADPSDDQVLLKLYSSGVCHSQLHQMHNPEFERPMIIGHEGTGVVVKTGRNVDHVEEGDPRHRHVGSAPAHQGKMEPADHRHHLSRGAGQRRNLHLGRGCPRVERLRREDPR